MADVTAHNSGWHTARGDRQRLEQQQASAVMGVTSSFASAASAANSSSNLNAAAQQQQGGGSSMSSSSLGTAAAALPLNIPPPKAGVAGAPSGALDVGFIRVFARRAGVDDLRKDVVWFQFAVSACNNKYQWSVEKRYSECLQLHQRIGVLGLTASDHNHSLEPFPGKTSLSLKNMFSFYGGATATNSSPSKYTVTTAGGGPPSTSSPSSSSAADNENLAQRQDGLDKYFASLLRLLQILSSASLFAVGDDSSSATSSSSSIHTQRVAFSLLINFLRVNSTSYVPAIPEGLSSHGPIDTATSVDRTASSSSPLSSTTITTTSTKARAASTMLSSQSYYHFGQQQQSDGTKPTDKAAPTPSPSLSGATTSVQQQGEKSSASLPPKNNNGSGSDGSPSVVVNTSHDGAVFTVVIMFPFAEGAITSGPYSSTATAVVTTAAVVPNRRRLRSNTLGTSYPAQSSAPSASTTTAQLPLLSKFLDVRFSTLTPNQIVIAGEWPTAKQILRMTMGSSSPSAGGGMGSDDDDETEDDGEEGGDDGTVSTFPRGKFEKRIDTPAWLSEKACGTVSSPSSSSKVKMDPPSSSSADNNKKTGEEQQTLIRIEMKAAFGCVRVTFDKRPRDDGLF